CGEKIRLATTQRGKPWSVDIERLGFRCRTVVLMLLLVALMLLWCSAAIADRYGPSTDEQLTVFPAGPTAVMLVHGGWWTTQTRDVELEAEARWLQGRGITVYDVGYPQCKARGCVFPVEVEAIERATRYAQRRTSGRLSLIGGSAGGT